jgi:hypothetical protein
MARGAPGLLRAMYVRVEVLADAERIEAHEVEGLHNHLRHERTNTQTSKHSNEGTGEPFGSGTLGWFRAQSCSAVRSCTISSNEPNGRTAMSNTTYRPTTVSADMFIGDDVGCPLSAPCGTDAYRAKPRLRVYACYMYWTLRASLGTMTAADGCGTSSLRRPAEEPRGTAARSAVGSRGGHGMAWRGMACLDDSEDDILAVVLRRKEVHAPAGQVVRCTHPFVVAHRAHAARVRSDSRQSVSLVVTARRNFDKFLRSDEP